MIHIKVPGFVKLGWMELKRFKMWILIFIAVLIIIYLGFGFYVAYGISHQAFPEKEVLASPKLISENYEDVSFQTKDGLTLKGWFFAGGDKVIILVHGITQNRHDRNYYFVPLMRDLLAENYSVLTFDMRAHGLSDGKATTYGRTEGNDFLASVDFIKSRGYRSEKIAVVANSFGAISTLMVGGNLDVAALVLDSVPSDFRPVFVRRLWLEKHIPTFLTPFGLWLAKELYNLDLDEIKPIEKVKEIPETPILFLHGEKDETFFVEDGKKVAQAHPGSNFVVFKDAPHIASYRTDPVLWKSEVFSFLRSLVP